MKYPVSMKLLTEAISWWKAWGFSEKTVPGLAEPRASIALEGEYPFTEMNKK